MFKNFDSADWLVFWGATAGFLIISSIIADAKAATAKALGEIE